MCFGSHNLSAFIVEDFCALIADVVSDSDSSQIR